MAIEKAVQIGVAAEAGKDIELEVKDDKNPEEDVTVLFGPIAAVLIVNVVIGDSYL